MVSWSKAKYRALAKGYHGVHKNCIRAIVPRLEKDMHNAYKNRQKRPSIFRNMWISTLSPAIQEHKINYNQFICSLNKSNMVLNRKVLANMAINEPYSFKAIVDEIIIQGEIKKKDWVNDNKEERMTYSEALAKKYLVKGDVIPEEATKQQFPLIILNEDTSDNYWIDMEEVGWYQRTDNR